MKKASLDKEYSPPSSMRIKSSHLPAIIVISAAFRRLANRVRKKEITKRVR